MELFVIFELLKLMVFSGGQLGPPCGQYWGAVVTALGEDGPFKWIEQSFPLYKTGFWSEKAIIFGEATNNNIEGKWKILNIQVSPQETENH